MKNWLLRNEKTIIASAFVIPIIIVAIVSISHVTQWYGLSNPLSWAVYLSIGIEIAAMSALAAITAKMGKNVYFPFIIVTLLQFIGNIFFSYTYINVNSVEFKNWVELVSPLVGLMGVEPTDILGHKRFLSLFSGGMLPIISLSFLHMLIKYTDRISIDNEKKIEDTPKTKELLIETLDEEPIFEKKTEVQIEDIKPIDEVMFVNVNDIPDIIEPIVDKVIVEEPIVQPEVSNEVVEEVKEQTSEEFLQEIYDEIRKEENEIEHEILESIPEIIEEENTEEVHEQTSENIVDKNFTSTSLNNVKNFPKVKRNGTKFIPPEIKWGS